MKTVFSLSMMSALLLLQSCATGPDLSNPEIRAQVSRVRHYNESELTGKDYATLSTVEAKVCTSNHLAGGNRSEEGAISELKFNASKLGGNGIRNFQCHTTGIDLSINCNSATVCYADVIAVNM